MTRKKFFPLNLPRCKIAPNKIAKKIVNSVTSTMIAIVFCIACRKFSSPIRDSKLLKPTNSLLFVIPPIRYSDILNTLNVGTKMKSVTRMAAGAIQQNTNRPCAFFRFIPFLLSFEKR